MVADFVESLATRSENSKRFAYFLGFVAAVFFAVQHVLTNPFYGQILDLRGGENRTLLLLEGILWTEIIALVFVALFLLGGQTRQTGTLVLENPETRKAIIESAITGVLSLSCYVWAQSGLEFYQVAILAGVSPFTYAIVARVRSFVWQQEASELAQGYVLAWFGVASVVLIAVLVFEDIASWSLPHVIPALFVPGFFYWGYAAIRETHSRNQIFAGSMVATGIATLVLSLGLVLTLLMADHDFAANEIQKIVFVMGAVGTISTAFFAKLAFQAGLYASRKVEDILSFFMFLIPLLSMLIAFALSTFIPMVEFSVDGYKILMGSAAVAAIYFLDNFNNQRED